MDSIEEYFENWPNWLRWFLFIPICLIAYAISILLARFCFWWSYGWFGIPETSFTGLIFYGFITNFIGFYTGILFGVSCAPRWKITISSVYLGIVIFAIGFSLVSYITNGALVPMWSIVYDMLLNLLAGITVLLIAVHRRQQIRDKFANIMEQMRQERIEREANMTDEERAREAFIRNKLGL